MSQPVTVRTDTGDEDLDLPEFEARIRRGEVSPKSLVRFPLVTGTRFVLASELEYFRVLHQPRRAHFAQAFALSRFPWITSAIILVNLAVYVCSVRGGPLDIDGMVRFGGKVGPLITDLGEFWRLLSANFLHRDALHVGLNMFVLFHVGGTLENTYRLVDYLSLLLLAGLTTTTVSLFLSDAVSLGASGVVFGCLGGVVVFGLKHRSILPSRYRRILGEAAIPTVIGLLLIGLTSPDVDNWGHLGGLGAGMVGAAFIRPRLLVDHPTTGWEAALRAVPAVIVLISVVFGQPFVGKVLPMLHLEHDDSYGISVPVPDGWRRGANRLGQLAYYNGLPGLGRATFAAEAVETNEPLEQAKRFIDESLQPSALGSDVLKVNVEAPRSTSVAGRQALSVRASLDERFGTTHLVAYFVPRGGLVYQLVFSYPAAYPRYAHVIDLMVAGIRLEEARALREARARALLFPNAPWAMAGLGEALRRQGEPRLAATALEAALRDQPSNPYARAQLALALFQAGELEEACVAARAAVLYAPNDAAALEVEARCELQRGNLQKALARLKEARKIAPTDERLKQAETKLRATLEP